jgi:polysaccharide biosynthesis transport protein
MDRNLNIDEKYREANIDYRFQRNDFGSNLNDSEIDIRQIIGILRRQYKLILSTIFAIVAVALLFTFTLSPKYTASALILVDTSRKNLLDEASQIGAASADNARVESEVEILRSDNVLMSIINEKGLTSDPEFGVRLSTRDKILGFLRVTDAALPTGQDALAAVLNSLRSATTVRRKGLTYLISVEVEAKSPERASELANALANAYISLQLQSKVDSALFGRSRIVTQSDEARQAVVAAENELTQYLTNNIDQLAAATGRSDIGQIRDTISSLSSQKEKATAQITTLRAGIQTKDWSSLVSGLEDNAVSELQKQRTELLKSIGAASSGSQVAVNLQNEMAKVDSELAKAAQIKVTELESSLQNADAELTKTRRQFTEIAARAELPADALAQIYQLQQTARNATNTYELLLSRAQDLETQSAIQIADSRLISPALIPNSPSFPNKKLIFALALLFAIGLGTALAFLYEMFIGGFTSSEQLEAITGFTVATVLPHQTEDASSASVADTIIDRPLSAYSEGTRRLRANIDRFLRSSPGASQTANPHKSSVIMVSSALPSEGKSTMALSLARAYAVDGYKTLLIDCDLRRPSIHRQLNVAASSSLVDYLRSELGTAVSADFTIKDPKSTLTAIIGSRPADIPTDHLLTDRSFAALLESARKKFDYVIVDTPPIDPVVDGLYVSEHADAIVFVVHWAKTAQRIVTKSLNILAKYMPNKTEMFLVLNQDEQRGGFAYKYGGYYTE